MNLNEIITNPLFSLSGWVFGLISVIIGIFQLVKRKKCEEKMNIMQGNSRNPTIGHSSQYIEKNDGSINISHNHK